MILTRDELITGMDLLHLEEQRYRARGEAIPPELVSALAKFNEEFARLEAGVAEIMGGMEAGRLVP